MKAEPVNEPLNPPGVVQGPAIETRANVLGAHAGLGKSRTTREDRISATTALRRMVVKLLSYSDAAAMGVRPL
jgi:hypothetical protein